LAAADGAKRRGVLHWVDFVRSIATLAPVPSPLCALCSSDGKLEQSHVIPQFVYRGLKQPGGPTRPLLCGECEDRFSLWESSFARDVFHPLVAGKPVSVKYGPWLSKFAASVCWRILENARRENRPGAIQADDCLKTWNDFLRGRRPDVGPYHLHLLRKQEGGRGFLVLHRLGDGGMPRRSTIECEATSDNSAAWVYAKLGPLILFGLIRDDTPGQWSGTRINAEGKLKPRVQVIPDRYRQYLASRV
jgi:hypothetical protein